MLRTVSRALRTSGRDACARQNSCRPVEPPVGAIFDGDSAVKTADRLRGETSAHLVRRDVLRLTPTGVIFGGGLGGVCTSELIEDGKWRCTASAV